MHHLLEKYFYGSCTEEEYQEIISWMNNPENDLYLSGALRGVWQDILKNNNKIDPDKQLLDHIHHHIALKEQSQHKNTIRLYRQILGLVAMLIIGLVIHALLFFQSYSPEDIITHNITVPYGGNTNFTLPDGSVVWINSGSTFSYPSEFRNERVVELKG